MAAEAGGHRIQRIPPTERRGRVHSSTVTVAVLDAAQASKPDTKAIDEGDLQITWFNGTIKAGGQFRNKTATACRLIHIPTGIVKTAQTRSRENSYSLALEAMRKELSRRADAEFNGHLNAARRSQVGSGERSDRRRVWAFQRGVVDDAISGKSIRISDALKGRIDRLW